MMRILVDADACPVIRIIEQYAVSHAMSVILFSDTSHQLQSQSSEVVVVGEGADAVDLALINRCQTGDVVVTQDYGVATLALGKRAFPIHPSGLCYTNDNIDQLLMERHVAGKLRRSKSKVHFHNMHKRTDEDDKAFADAFDDLVQKALNLGTQQ